MTLKSVGSWVERPHIWHTDELLVSLDSGAIAYGGGESGLAPPEVGQMLLSSAADHACTV